MANKKISELPDATIPLAGSELVEIVQGGLNKKCTTQDIGNLGGGGGGGGTWGSITGTLSDQLDLQAALDAKVSSVSGTANRITSSGGMNPVIDIAATYVGQTSITTLGTITTGIWTGTVIGSSYGGAGTVNGILKANGSGVVSAAVAGTDYLTPSGSGAALTGVWLLASGGTLSGANDIIGTSTNLINHSFDGLGVTITRGAGLRMRNQTAAAAGAQQVSPILTFEGRGWATTGSVSRTVIWDVYNLPVQGAAPTGSLIFASEINGVATNGRLTLNSDGARLVSQANGLQILTNGGGVGGLSFNGSAATSGQITITPGSFAISTASSWISAGNGINMSVGVAVSATSGTQNLVNFSGSFVPTSGTAVCNFWNFSDVVNQTGGANGQVRGLNLAPIFTACAAFTAYNYDPTTPNNVSGAHYGVRIVPAAVLSSFGHGTPVSTVDIDGSLGLDITSPAGDLTLNDTHHTILSDATAAARTITLPTAASSVRRIYVVKKIDSSVNTVTVDGNGSETIDGALTFVLSSQWSTVGIQSNGTAWFVRFQF